MDTVKLPPVPDTVTQKPVDGLVRAGNSPEKLQKISEEFEALLIQSMFKAMRRTIPEGGLFEKKTSHRIYEEMMDAEISKALARRRDLGIADTIYGQVNAKKNAK